MITFNCNIPTKKALNISTKQNKQESIPNKKQLNFTGSETALSTAKPYPTNTPVAFIPLNLNKGRYHKPLPDILSEKILRPQSFPQSFSKETKKLLTQLKENGLDDKKTSDFSLLNDDNDGLNLFNAMIGHEIFQQKQKELKELKELEKFNKQTCQELKTIKQKDKTYLNNMAESLKSPLERIQRSLKQRNLNNCINNINAFTIDFNTILKKLDAKNEPDLYHIKNDLETSKKSIDSASLEVRKINRPLKNNNENIAKKLENITQDLSNITTDFISLTKNITDTQE